jgi:hypothetical protein
MRQPKHKFSLQIGCKGKDHVRKLVFPYFDYLFKGNDASLLSTIAEIIQDAIESNPEVNKSFRKPEELTKTILVEILKNAKSKEK